MPRIPVFQGRNREPGPQRGPSGGQVLGQAISSLGAVAQRQADRLEFEAAEQKQQAAIRSDRKNEVLGVQARTQLIRAQSETRIEATQNAAIDGSDFEPIYRELWNTRSAEINAQFPRIEESLNITSEQMFQSQLPSLISTANDMSRADLVDTMGQTINEIQQNAASGDISLNTASALIEQTLGAVELSEREFKDSVDSNMRSVMSLRLEGLIDRGEYEQAEVIIASDMFNEFGNADLQLLAEEAIRDGRGRQDSALQRRMAGLFDSDEQSTRTTGIHVQDLTALTPFMTDEQVLQLEQSREDNLSIFNVTSQFPNQSPQDMSESLEIYRPEAGSPDFAREQAVYTVMAQSASRVLTARQNDPFGAVMAVDGAAEEYNEAVTTLGPEAASDLAIQAQIDLGVSPLNVRVFRPEQAQALVQQMNSGDIEEMQQAITTVNAYGDSKYIALRETIGEGAHPEIMAMAYTDDPSLISRIGPVIGKSDSDFVGDLTPLDVDRVRSAFMGNDYFQSLFNSFRNQEDGVLAQTGVGAPLAPSVLDPMFRTVLDSVARGERRADAIKAMATLVGQSIYTSPDGDFYIPRSINGVPYPAQNVGDMTEVFIGPLIERLNIGSTSVFGVPTELTSEEMTRNVLNTGHFITTDQGLALSATADNGISFIVEDVEGNPITFSWEVLMEADAVRAAEASARIIEGTGFFFGTRTTAIQPRLPPTDQLVLDGGGSFIPTPLRRSVTVERAERSIRDITFDSILNSLPEASTKQETQATDRLILDGETGILSR